MQAPSLAALLRVRPGLTALIGGGGKTTLLYALAEELHSRGSVIVASSTKIRRPEHLPVADPATPEALQAALRSASCLCLGRPWPEDKLAAPSLGFSELVQAADYVLVEADGAKGLPAKAHAPHEPVIPAEAERVILVLGADAFDAPISQVCHRPERFAALAGTALDAPLTPARWARVLQAEGYGDMIYVNKCETAADYAHAAALAALLSRPVLAGSLRDGVLRRMKKEQ
ncbi:MAG: putative selenium-dependent hydroxylase accessory protein YqeC [Oscillospiraceae bacterium]|nr:putative selenium-dependent hydroxylase accessory protein YqeC [Oscillospiraceae bacterium]